MTTESDRELLELAAKAAGIAIPKSLNSWMTYSDQSGFQWLNMDGTRTEKVFNPLNDDGDALRLAVKLNFVVEHRGSVGQSYAGTLNGLIGSSVDAVDDPYAATRRAIVRAAAAIARATHKEQT